MIISYINAPQEQLASFLNTILATLIALCPYACKNSAEFVEEVKKIILQIGEKMFSYDAEALFPSVPIPECIDVILAKLNADPTLSQRTRLSPVEICDLLRLCLEVTDFTYDGKHNTTKNSGPDGHCLSNLDVPHYANRGCYRQRKKHSRPMPSPHLGR